MKRIIIILSLVVAVLMTCSVADHNSETILFPLDAPGQITFVGDAGSPNVFTVNQWKFTRVENPDQPEQIGITAVLDMASISCDWKDLEQALHKKKDYFHSKKWKTATITIDGAVAQEDGSYIAQAKLEMKGIDKEIPVNFTISGGGEEPYSVSATAEVMRRMWNFTGNGPKDEVPVTVEAELVVSE